MTTAALIDAVAAERVLVFGSLPPAARDLDLLVGASAQERIGVELKAAGFVRQGQEWVRFAECSANAVDIVPVSDWSLPEPELVALFARATPISGFVNLVEPAPHHQLLILATRLLPGGKGMTPGRRRRAQRAIDADPTAWTEASAQAPAWGMPAALEELREALTPERDASGLQAARRAGWRLRNQRVIALSGVDGSGKSSQAQALQTTLKQLGHEAVIVWTPLASDAWLEAIGAPAKRVLGRVSSLRSPPTEGPRGLVPNPGSELRKRSPAVNQAWATLVALGNAAAHARLTLRHTLAGRVVIFDRYVLDSVVRLRFLYGEDGQFPLQRALISLFSPRPVAAFFFDVSAEASLTRKQDRWAPEELATQVRLYREEHAKLGVRRLDGMQSQEALCAAIAEAVWRELAELGF